jgi:hypothetical protein
MRFPYSPHLIKKISSEFYYYGHDEVGDLGVTETPSGDTQLRPYVKDPVELNRDIAAQVAQQMADALIEHADRQPDGARHSPHLRLPFPALRSPVTPCFPASAAGE